MSLLMIAAFNLLAGFNDGGNLVATVLPLRVPPAFLWLWLTGAVGLGPLLVGTAVAHTVAYGIVALPREVTALPAMALAATLTVLLSWWRRLPTSMSLALVGAMVGVSVVHRAPVFEGGVARTLVGFVLAVALGYALGFLAFRGLARLPRRPYPGWPTALALLVLATLLGVAYGGNDLEKAVGLFTLAGLPLRQAVFLSVGSFSVGTFVGAWRVARTVSARILHLRSTEALPTQWAAGVAVLAAARAGVPVSTSQTVDAAILGVGSARHPKSLGWRVARAMTASWVLTPPLAFVLGVVTAWVFSRISAGI
jgi:PiT family inorganic phosphate transporter